MIGANLSFMPANMADEVSISTARAIQAVRTAMIRENNYFNLFV